MPNLVPDVKLMEIEGEPRARDLDIGKRLGMKRPRVIRDLIKRHLPELEQYGEVCRSLRQTSAAGGRPGEDFFLNEEQALMISTVSNAPNAPTVRGMLIRVFVAFRRGHVAPILPQAPDEVARIVTSAFGTYFEAATRFLGLDKNQAALCADRATKATTGVTMLGAMGVNYLEAPNQTALVTPTRLGEEIARRGGVAMSAKSVNLRLKEMGMQVLSSGGTSNWEPTERGKAAGGRMVDVPRANTEGTAQQLRWPLDVAQLVFGASL